MKDKLINILLVFMCTLLIMNFFSSKDKEVIKTGIAVETVKKYTVPASVKINVTNYDTSDFSFNTCSGLTIKKDTKVITSSKCEDIVLKQGKNYLFDLSDQYKDFSEVGEYYISLKTGTTEKLSTFEIKNPGIFGKFFNLVFQQPIHNLMIFLLQITNYSLGWAIIIITIIIRALLIYPQHKMMVNQKKMQIIQPKIKDLQEKHKGDHQTLGMELMNLYKEHKLNPMGSFGLLFIQMPILIVIYNVIIGIKSPSNAFYLYPFLGNYDVSSINANFFGLDLFGVGGINGLILAVIIGVLQFLQVKLSLSYNKKDEKKGVVLEKKKDANDYSSMMPDPEFMNKFMMIGLPIMVGFFTYSFFLGVGLYWGVGTIFMIFQQLIVNKVLKK